ncbi:FAD/NAD(P)-binding domain-containing protein [Coniophora puteana RWD-64-598 SS2]|uniref:FAD/NAD(P)-binding domain-containing protein n=1 Tax=Coniophora puteana (strain RWD-64-598) TaxID=741705 RepID=A0A5M3N239_CONPW|nr:FAD/NAD(P)-binding domain-containing protein [Coniophora puteana RWD-64-598 SS2]EIW85438.1 FAD/NAD(P)-binding domain-containing protein [Coniophora puteana RWD-64-598 SS2]
MSESKRFSVIVAGGGTAGASVAFFLSQLNVNVTVLESRPGRQTDQRGSIVILGPNGMNVMHKGLDASNVLLSRQCGLPVPHIYLHDNQGSVLGSVPQGTVERFGFQSHVVTRWDIQEVIMDKLETSGGEYVWNAKFESFEEVEDGVVVRWTEAGKAKERQVDLLIGADGIWSKVRTSLHQKLGLDVPKPRYSGLAGFGGDLEAGEVPGISQILTKDKPVVMYRGRTGFMGIGLLDGPLKRMWWWVTNETPDRPREEWKMSRDEIFKGIDNRFGDWASPIPEILAAAKRSDKEIFVWPINELGKLKNWHTDRVVLIGDAAHAMPPHSGQGASQALEDAAYFANLLRDFLEKGQRGGEELKAVLAAFQTGRQPRVNMILDEANKRGDNKRDIGAVKMFLMRWTARFFFMFASDSWFDTWFGYEVPGIDKWAELRQGHVSKS